MNSRYLPFVVKLPAPCTTSKWQMPKVKRLLHCLSNQWGTQPLKSTLPWGLRIPQASQFRPSLGFLPGTEHGSVSAREKQDGWQCGSVLYTLCSLLKRLGPSMGNFTWLNSLLPQGMCLSPFPAECICQSMLCAREGTASLLLKLVPHELGSSKYFS